MKSFDNIEFEQYNAEAKERWGETEAYKDHSKKTKNYSKEKWNSLAAEMNDIFAELTKTKQT